MAENSIRHWQSMTTIDARRAAEETLLDRTVFMVSPKVYRDFLARLDKSPKPNARLRRSMRTPVPW